MSAVTSTTLSVRHVDQPSDIEQRYNRARVECHRIKLAASVFNDRSPIEFTFRPLADYKRNPGFGIGIDIKSRIGVADLDGDLWQETADVLRRTAAELIATAKRLEGGVE